MYFEIENTPEEKRRARRAVVDPKKSPIEECPRLILAPFSKPPKVVFENVLLGTTCEKELEVFNPLKQVQQITLGKALPPGLVIHLPGDWLVLEPESCYSLTMTWTPMQSTALRENIRFTNEQRGRYDVIIVLKSVMNLKGKNPPKGFKVSPGKIKKKTGKKSPVAIYKKKAEVIYNTTKIKKTVIQSTQYNVLKNSNKENISTFNDYSMEYQPAKCPFDSPTKIDFTFNTSEIFSNVKKTNHNILQNTYDKSYSNSQKLATTEPEIPCNILKPSNRQVCDISATELFDNLTFTPLKTRSKTDKLNKGPKIILSMNSDSELDDSLNVKTPNKENDTHSIIFGTSAQTTKKWLIDNQQQKIQQLETNFTDVDIHSAQNKKIPNTSSPKEMNSPNFSMNTELSRISDLSFFPQRFSTEKKVVPKLNNDTHYLLEDPNAKLNSDTYTKDSPNTPLDFHFNQINEVKPPHFFMKEQGKMCKQSLFRESQQPIYDRNYLCLTDVNFFNREGPRSPPRSITPPLQSIPEESTNFCDSQVGDKTNKQTSFTSTFTMNRTFDKVLDRNSLTNRQSWSKKSIRGETELWKIPTAPPKKSLKPKLSIGEKDSFVSKMSNTYESDQTIRLNQVSNVYSQSSTVDPFLSISYFYDEEAVNKFEEEFKRWLNYILTPPADLESNIEQKIDVGKAWIENRNKEIPAAPTKEQVSSAYHNSRRLESLRKAARTLFMSSEMQQVFEKLNLQIEKKLIAIRADRNLHLDVGLQKVIMELLLSYNPLWLRIGLEAVYGVVLPLKSNSDIDGLTTFIIQRMFKNPYIKNKHSKSSAPNMLLPAYMEAIKKFTLKKFFMLVFFLDQAKQKKLISHDPCLFCRNAVCKESREIIIRFTRESIAGIGDITKHLRPIGYVVSHKQSYLDEYKYAVHNIALDIRDGVRITKVMEIILMKNGLLNQLRTPAISRLQKIHNIQVALNALKEANFEIVGDITAQDIADGHREKTLSLLWQLIHVLRAPLFEGAANVIQTWWRKKYEVILETREKEERLQQKLNMAASIIQCWWRRIQYNRLVEWQMKQITSATIVIQKYCRMWLCRSQHRRRKRSALKIEEWYRSKIIIREAKATLESLRLQREELRQKSAIKLQSYVRRWLCTKEYKNKVEKIVRIQSVMRCIILKKRFLQLKHSATLIQRLYRGKLKMREDMKKFVQKRKAAIIIQSQYKMIRERRKFNQLKQSVKTIEERYIGLIKMRTELKNYQNIKRSTVLIQARWRGVKCRREFCHKKNVIINLQKRFRANVLMKKEKKNFSYLKKAVITLQQNVRSYLIMKKTRQAYLRQRNAAILIQRCFRAQIIMKSQRLSYVRLRNSAIILQNHYKALLIMRKERTTYINLRNAAITLQRRYRAKILMKHYTTSYQKLQSAVIKMQRRFRAQQQMKDQRNKYLKLKFSCSVIKNAYRAYIQGKQQRSLFLKQKQAAIVIQNWFTTIKQGKTIQQEYMQTKEACVSIQRIYRAYIIGRKQRQEYLKIKVATLKIQNYYRSYIEMKRVREQFISMKTACITIQKFYKSYRDMEYQRKDYLEIKFAAQFIQKYYRRYRESKQIRNDYSALRNTVLFIQRRYRSICMMRVQRKRFLALKENSIFIQQKYRALLSMRKQRKAYEEIRESAMVIQSRYRAHCLMKKQRFQYMKTRNACVSIQRYFRAYLAGKHERNQYLALKKSAITIQEKYRALIAMRKERRSYLTLKTAAINVQKRFRAQALMKKERADYQATLKASLAIQKRFRAYITGRERRQEYIKLRTSVMTVQTWFRRIIETRKIRNQYLHLRNVVVLIQRRYRDNVLAREIRQQEAATQIQKWYRCLQQRNECRRHFLKIKTSVVTLQSAGRMFIHRRRFLKIYNSTLIIQRFYRSYKITIEEQNKYKQLRFSIIRLQSYVRRFIVKKRYMRIRSAVLTLQAAYRWKKQIDLQRFRMETAALCIQKNLRRYLVRSKYLQHREKVLYVQKIWRGKLVTRLLRCEFLQKKKMIIKLQSRIRGYLIRKNVQIKKKEIQKKREEQRHNWAASIIQAHYRGHRVREAVNADHRVTELRRRWREGALKSTQETMKERNEEAMGVLHNYSDIDTIIRAFQSLELLTEVFPMMYNNNAPSIVRRVYIYMSATNRSISSVEVLTSAAAILVNLTRYRVTGPKIYNRDCIPPIIKFMFRFSNSETQLFCILCTYLWLFSKYKGIKEDLTEFLNIPENQKMLLTIKSNVERMRRMANNTRNKLLTPQTHKFVSHTGHQAKHDNSIILPALEPDYGITRADKPPYFEDAHQAISCLFHTYNL